MNLSRKLLEEFDHISHEGSSSFYSLLSQFDHEVGHMANGLTKDEAHILREVREEGSDPINEASKGTGNVTANCGKEVEDAVPSVGKEIHNTLPQ